MTLKVCCALLVLVALPFILDATIGCSYAPPAAEVAPNNSYVCSCKCEPEQRHRDLRVGVASDGGVFNEDDAEQQLTGNILLNSPDLDFLNGRYVGLRFRDVGIPKDAPILHARVQFTASAGSNTEALTVQIAGVAADNAAPFSTTPGSLGALPITVNTVPWNLPNWTAGDAGGAQLTPELAPLLQEIVNQAGWVEGNALALLIKGTAGSNTALRKAYSLDGGLDFAAVLSVDYTEPLANVEVLQHLAVCVPPADNANVGGTEPDDAALTADCGDNTLGSGHRVQDTVHGLALACHYPSSCVCSVIPGSQKYKGSCDLDTGSGPGVCTPSVVAIDCSNFNPPQGIVTATNAPGDEPVCAANSPLSAAMFGRRTSCEVEGTTHVEVGDRSEDSHTRGLVEFKGDPCPGQPCAVGMEYRLDMDPVTFGNFFHSETFSDLAGLGENVAGNEAMLSSAGDGMFVQHTLAASAQGRRGSDVRGLVTTNDDVVNVNVGWDQNVCHLDGALIGSVDPEAGQCEAGPDAGKPCEDDSECTNDDACSDGVCNCVAIGDQGITLRLDVDGNIMNQPPAADAGPGQDVECTTAAVTNVVLDASGSSDPEGNIRLYSWLRGSRAGNEVAFDQVSKVEQSLGSTAYVLRVIDAFGQAGEDSTQVNVVDTTPPVVSCSVATPVLNQTNHDLVNVGLAGSAVDQCEGELSVTVNVFADEDDEENTGDGRHSPDAKDLAVGSLRLRAERKGNSDGRVYLVIAAATDSSGNRGFSCCTVTVPHSSAPAAQMSAQAQAAAAQAFCLDNAGTPPAGYFGVGDGPVLGPKQ